MLINFRISIIALVIFGFFSNMKMLTPQSKNGSDIPPIQLSQTDEAEDAEREPKTFSYMPEDIFSKDTPIFLILIFAFFYGILVSLTPCVYPMIPITAAIVSASASSSMIYNFFLSLVYVIGSAITYATLGLFVAFSGGIFGQWLSNPWFLCFLALFFIYFAGTMFGFYEMYIPGVLAGRENIQTKGSLIYTFFAGIISGTIASPCISPALAALLIYVANTKNPLLGFITLFTFALGMGILLLIIGTWSSALKMFPSSGLWMIEVKRFFGFVILAVCVYFISPILSQSMMYFLISIILFSAMLYYFITGSQLRRRQNYFKIALGVLLIPITVLTLANAWYSSFDTSIFHKISNVFRKKS